jgi:hypothetical protein
MLGLTKTAAPPAAPDPNDSGAAVLRATVAAWAKSPGGALVRLAVEANVGLEALGAFGRGQGTLSADALGAVARAIYDAEYLPPPQDKLRRLPARLPEGVLAAHPAPVHPPPFQPKTPLQKRLAAAFAESRAIQDAEAAKVSGPRVTPMPASTYEQRRLGWID